MSAVEGAGRTHRRIDTRLCGSPLEMGHDRAVVELTTLPEMGVDETNLVHGGFVFGLADHAAMLAIDEPTVVLAGAEVRFVAPTRVGERLAATATVVAREGRKRRVEVSVRRGGEEVLRGLFSCYVPLRHVLEP